MNNFVLASSNIAAQVSIGALKATVILVLASAIAHCLRRQSAATRHMVWTSSLVGAISVLLLPLILPAWRVLPSPLVNTRLTRTTPSLSPNSQMPAHRTRDSREETMSSAALSSPEQKTSVAQSPVTLPSALIATIRNWKMLLSCVWLAGVLTLVARYSRSDWVMSRVLQQATPLPEGRCADLLSRIMRQWRVTRPVALAESHDVDLPIAYGTLRPRIVLPVEASEWSLQRCEYVLQHELAHVRRLDACTQFVSQIASAIFWFHPLIWYACRQMRFERERACDDYVLASGAQASDYASDLLAMVQCYGCCGEHPTALAMLRRSQFEGRLCALLDQGLRRDVLSRSKLMCGTVVAALLVVPLAVVRGANPRQTPAAASDSCQSRRRRPA